MHRLLSRTGPTLLLAGLTGWCEPAEARPLHNAVFKTEYGTHYAQRQSLSCTVCHRGNGSDKRELNPYGEAVRQQLDGKRPVDRAAISEGLRAIEHLPSQIPKRTFGDLIRIGLLPGIEAVPDRDQPPVPR